MKILKFIFEGFVFLACIAMIYFFTIFLCALSDKCYYYYFPGLI
tara:strand:+ start:210 stop:341 length:132 start_codon:yes stop_codon:yes gene_type:complete